MLGVGWLEMLLIGVVALIVIGPKELPALMHKIGQFAGTIRRMGTEFQRELNKTTGLDEIKNLRQSVTQPLKATADAIRKEFNTTTATGQVQPSGAIKPANPKVESVVDEIKAAAGMTPAAAVPLVAPAEAVKAPVKATRPPRIKAPTESKVVTADIPPVAKKAAAKPKQPIEAPAPAKAAPARKATVKAAAPVAKAAAPVAKAESVAAKPAPVAKPAAKKPADKASAPTAKPTATKTAAATKKPAAKKSAAPAAKKA